MSNQDEKHPKATHAGSWVIDEEKNIVLQCYVMDNGERVLSLRGASQAMGLSVRSKSLPRVLNRLWISKYLTEELRTWLENANRNNLPVYITDKGKPFTPFEASLFVDLCSAYVNARHDNALSNESQKEVADTLYIIMTAFAKVGLVAIIDEVTGYQYDRNRDELQKILAKYISAEMLPWAKRFPDEFYENMFRLNGWEYSGKGKARPSYAGKLTNKYIYEYLPPGVLEEMRVKNPKDPSTGRRKKRHHQWLTNDTGIKHLDAQLQQTIALMKASDNWEEFERLFKKAMGEPYQLTLPDVLN